MKKIFIIFGLTTLLTVFAAQVVLACCPYSNSNCPSGETCVGFSGGAVTCSAAGVATFSGCSGNQQYCVGATPTNVDPDGTGPLTSIDATAGICQKSAIGTKECCILKQTIDLGDTANPLKCDGGRVAAPSQEAANICGGIWCGTTVTNEKNWGIFCMMDSMFNVTNWVFYILTVVAVIMFIWGGFSYVTSAGEPEKAGKGKKILTYGIIGLAIALLAKAIPSVVKAIVGM